MDSNLILQLIIATFAGSVLGTVVGMLPGVGPTACIAVILPYVIGMPPVISLALVSAVYYGTQYGGSTTSILFKIPGEASSVVTCLDGHQMFLEGRGWTALKVAAIGSFIAGMFGIALIYLVGPGLARLSTFFTPNELFILSAAGIVFSTSIFTKDRLQSLYGALIGVLLSFVGFNILSGYNRFTNGTNMLVDGFDMVVVIGGLLGGTEILKQLFGKTSRIKNIAINQNSMGRNEVYQATGAIGRGTLFGSILGLIPGGGAILASYITYALEGLFTKNLGTGKIEGVAAPESANNAAAMTAFIPLLALGIPENAVMALIFGLMLHQGLAFGPSLFTNHSDTVSLILLSMFLGNLMLLVLNLPLLKILTKVYLLPEKILLALSGIFLISGVYLIQFRIIDVVFMLGFAAYGLLLDQMKIPPMTVVIGFVLGIQIEDRFAKALIISDGDYSQFVFNYATLFLLIIGILYSIIVLANKYRKL